MKEAPDKNLIASVLRMQKSIEKGWISPQEYTFAVLQELSETDCVSSKLSVAIWALVPEAVRSEFKAVLCRAALPGFSWRPFWIGPGRSSMTEVEMRRDDENRLGRIRAWAQEFARIWDAANESDSV